MRCDDLIARYAYNIYSSFHFYSSFLIIPEVNLSHMHPAQLRCAMGPQQSPSRHYTHNPLYKTQPAKRTCSGNFHPMVFSTTQETHPSRRPRCTECVQRPIYNRNATPRHVAWDASVQGTSGAFLSTHFWTNCIIRVSSHAHESRFGRALATCVMADRNGRCCTERALKGRPVRRSRHFVIVQSQARMDTSYCLCMGSPYHLTFSPLWPAKLRSGRGMLYSLGHVGAHGASVLASAGRGHPCGCARPTLPSAGHHGTTRGFLQGDSWCGVQCGRFVSCREVGMGHLCGIGSSCRKWNVAVSGYHGRAAQGVWANQCTRFG